MAESNIPKEISDSLKGIYTNINTERLSEILRWRLSYRLLDL